MAEENKNTQTTSEQGAGSAENNEQTNSAENTASAKKYTDDEVNGIVAKKEKKAVEKFLKDMGITDRAQAEQILKTAAQANNAGNAEADGQSQVHALQEKIEALENSYKTSAVRAEIQKRYHPKDVNDILPLIDMGKVSVENDTVSGLTEQVDPIKTNKSYLFEKAERSGLSHSDGTEIDKAALMAAFGIKQNKKE